MKSKEDLHRLVDELPDSEWDAARRYLEYLRYVGDPFMRALLEAPEDDEPVTPEEDEEAEEAWHDRGKARSWEEVREELARG